MIWELVLIMAVFFGTCGLGALLMVIEHWWSKRKRKRMEYENEIIWHCGGHQEEDDEE